METLHVHVIAIYRPFATQGPEPAAVAFLMQFHRFPVPIVPLNDPVYEYKRETLLFPVETTYGTDEDG